MGTYNIMIGAMAVAVILLCVVAALAAALRESERRYDDLVHRFDRLCGHYTELHPQEWVDQRYSGSIDAPPGCDPRWRPNVYRDDTDVEWNCYCYDPKKDTRPAVKYALGRH